MKFIFHNDFHSRKCTVTSQDWCISQQKLRRLWESLCGELDCRMCGYGGLHGEQKWRLRKLGGKLYNDGAEII